MRIILINARISSKFSGIECTYKELPPATALPLLACETERRLLTESRLRPEIRVYDRPIETESFLKFVSQSDMVGFTTWFSNSDRAISIATHIKRLNPKVQVVFGGPDSSNLGPRLLLNRPSIDFVVAGDGEDVLWRIAVGEEMKRIPNLWYRDKLGRVAFSYWCETDVETIESFDFRHVQGLDLTPYDSRDQNYTYDPCRLPISVAWSRGCPRSAIDRRCAYCSTPSTKVRFVSPERAWRQVDLLKTKYGISAFFEGGDDFTGNNYAEQLLQSSSRVKGINLRSYAGLWGLTEEKVGTLKELGLSEIFIGLETADLRVNRWSGHRISKDMVYRTLETLKAYDMTVCIPFLFGLPGESAESLASSEALASDLVDRFDNIRMVLVSLAIPLLGSRWFGELASDSNIRSRYGEDLHTTDSPNYAKLLDLSVGRFCAARISEIVETVLRIRARLSRKVTVGWFGNLDRILKGANSRSVQELLGHKSSVST